MVEKDACQLTVVSSLAPRGQRPGPRLNIVEDHPHDENLTPLHTGTISSSREEELMIYLKRFSDTILHCCERTSLES